ncbi:MAG: hypothetical protein WKF84_09250 [Pyrinomonadaceae bacterium]
MSHRASTRPTSWRFQVELNGEQYDTANEAANFYRAALGNASLSLPGVEAAAVTNVLPA